MAIGQDFTRRTCSDCGREFRSFPDSNTKRCARCVQQNEIRLPKRYSTKREHQDQAYIQLAFWKGQTR